MKVKIKNKMNLTLNERFVYMMLCNLCRTDKYTQVSRSFLCEKCDIKDPQTITNITNKLNKIKLISKETIIKPNNTKVTMYKIVDYNDDFLLFENSLLSTGLSKSAIALSTMLAPLRAGGKSYINLSLREISKKLDISRNTLKKYLKELIDNDIIIIDDDGAIYMNTDYFPVFIYKTKKAKEYEMCLKDMPKDSKAYKKYINLCKTNYEGIDNIESALFSILTES